MGKVTTEGTESTEGECTSFPLSAGGEGKGEDIRY